MRKLLNPILKLFINPNPVVHVLNMQGKINNINAQQFRVREELDALYYEVIHNLVLEVTRLGIETKNLKMRLESLSSRMDFDERRSRALENVVQYRAGTGPSREPLPVKPMSELPPAARPQPSQPASSPAASSSTSPSPSSPSGDQNGEAEGTARRRRRRRRGRRGGRNRLEAAGATPPPGDSTGEASAREDEADVEAYSGEDEEPEPNAQ
jgi:hypothetical protein